MPPRTLAIFGVACERDFLLFHTPVFLADLLGGLFLLLFGFSVFLLTKKRLKRHVSVCPPRPVPPNVGPAGAALLLCHSRTARWKERQKGAVYAATLLDLLRCDVFHPQKQGGAFPLYRGGAGLPPDLPESEAEFTRILYSAFPENGVLTPDALAAYAEENNVEFSEGLAHFWLAAAQELEGNRYFREPPALLDAFSLLGAFLLGADLFLCVLFRFSLIFLPLFGMACGLLLLLAGRTRVPLTPRGERVRTAWRLWLEKPGPHPHHVQMRAGLLAAAAGISLPKSDSIFQEEFSQLARTLSGVCKEAQRLAQSYRSRARRFP